MIKLNNQGKNIYIIVDVVQLINKSTFVINVLYIGYI